MKTGYASAVELAWSRLAALPPNAVCRRCGARWEEGTYYLSWLSREVALPQGKPPELILWLHYLLSEGAGPPRGTWMSYREAPGARFYEAKFMQRATRPLAAHFGGTPERLAAAGARLGGAAAGVGDVSVTVPLLPYLPLTYVLWSGDEEFEPSGGVLFDRTASGWLCAEDLAVAASLGAYALIAEDKKSGREA